MVMEINLEYLQLPLTYTSVGPVTPSNPLQGCGNQSLQRSGSVSKQEMGVLR